MDALLAAAEIPHAADLLKAVKAYRLEWGNLERVAPRAGLEICGRSAERRAVVDAVLAPVYAYQLRDLELTMAEAVAIAPDGSEPPRTTDRVHDQYANIEGLAYTGYDILEGMEPPSWAIDQTADLGNALRGLKYAAAGAIPIEERGTATPEFIRRHDRKIHRWAVRLDRSFRRLTRQVRSGGA